jgi:hypothetical protein
MVVSFVQYTKLQICFKVRSNIVVNCKVRAQFNFSYIICEHEKLLIYP